ncbi:DUF4360 domain-containing protein, partial [Streptomyces olivoreticuli]
MFTPVLIAGTAAALVAAALTPTSPAIPGETPPQDRVLIEIRVVNGACSSPLMSVSVSPDNTGFTVSHGGFTAQVGVGSKPYDSHKNCQILLSVNAPRGYTYAIAGTDYEG